LAAVIFAKSGLQISDSSHLHLFFAGRAGRCFSRTQGFYIVTSLLDATQYPAEGLAELSFKRWDVELFSRDIKTTMGLDILRCRTPEMIRKEILMYFIAYNCVRRLDVRGS
jgi:hypothetical protein